MTQNDPNTWSQQSHMYVGSRLFSDQLQAFSVWLQSGLRWETNKKVLDKGPDLLPIVLQMLLNPQHRTKTLNLLAQYLDLGAISAYHALSVGIFPYIHHKLLMNPDRQASGKTRFVLVRIWLRILLFDIQTREELYKGGTYECFIQELDCVDVWKATSKGEKGDAKKDLGSVKEETIGELMERYKKSLEHIARSSFILALIINNYGYVWLCFY